MEDFDFRSLSTSAQSATLSNEDHSWQRGWIQPEDPYAGSVAPYLIQALELYAGSDGSDLPNTVSLSKSHVKSHSYVCRVTLQENFNFSSTYSESSIMRSAICSACMPAKFLSTNSLT
jgi:hypothetical protein